MVKSAFRSVGMAIGLGFLFGPVQAYVSQKVWETWGRDWEVEARAASGVCTDGS